MPSKALVTGGSGYFGSLLVSFLLRDGFDVRVLDINDADDRPDNVEFVQGDIRDEQVVKTACTGMDVVFHNVAQVPLAKNNLEFTEVNVQGTDVLLRTCASLPNIKVVHTSSSAVFGIPKQNPVTEATSPSPAEAYGWAKYEAELLCHSWAEKGLDVSIIRPRTILGSGRLGIFAMLFDWIADGSDVFVLGSGANTYQFVQAEDLARACIAAGKRKGAETYNIGATEFGTMRETLESLAKFAGTGSKVRSLPRIPVEFAMRSLSALHLAPFAPYHWIMYGRSMYFDTSKAQRELEWKPEYSSASALEESYTWFLEHRNALAGTAASHHRKPVKQGALSLVKRLLRH